MKKLKVFVLSAFTSIFLISCGKSVPSNPDEYLHKIVNSEVQKTTSNLSRLQNLYSKALQNKDYEANEQIKLSIEDSYWDLVNTVIKLSGTDLGVDSSTFLSIDSISFNDNIKVQKNDIGINLNLALNDTEIVHANITSFTDKAETYFELPELLGSAIKVPYTIESLLQEAGINLSLKDYMETSAKFFSLDYKSFIDGLFSSIVSQIKNVEQSEVEVSAGKNNVLTSKYTLLSVTLTEEILKNMSNAMKEYCNSSKEFDSILNGLLSLTSSLSNQEINTQEIKEEIIYSLENLFNSYVLIDSKLMIYADALKSQGFALKLSEDYSDFELSLVKVSKKNSFGENINLSVQGNNIVLAGDGSVNGSKISGDYYLDYNNSNYVTFKVVDLENSEKNLSFGGKVAVSFSNAFFKLFEYDIDKSITALLKSFSYVFEAKGNESEAKISLSLTDKELNPFFSLTTESKTNLKTSSALKVPADYIDFDDNDKIYAELENLNLDKILENIDKSSISSDLKTLLRISSEYAEEIIKDNLF